MPQISRFLGIAVAMFYREHGPPHLYAIYGEFKVIVDIRTGIVTGRFPARALACVLQWARLHRSALLENWELARAGKPLRQVPPLE